MPPLQKGRNSSICTSVLIPIWREKLGLETLCRSSQVQKNKTNQPQHPFTNTSAYCAIWNGIFSHHWNQGWFILVWWPDLRNFVLSQYTLELCCSHNPALPQKLHPYSLITLLSLLGQTPWLGGSSYSTRWGVPWHSTVSRRAVTPYGKTKALGV